MFCVCVLGFFLRTAEIQKNLFRTEGLKITSGNWEISIHGDSVTAIPGLNLQDYCGLIHVFPLDFQT